MGELSRLLRKPFSSIKFVSALADFQGGHFHMLIPHAFRLTQGADLRNAILEYVQETGIQAGSLLSGVGCLSAATIRLANEADSLLLDGPLEILTLSGTLTPGHVHLHISVADKQGKVYGGHLLEGTLVSFTAEICLAEYRNLSFSRELDNQTGFTELVVKAIK